jgi:release factor glutamine methyltransferase
VVAPVGLRASVGTAADALAAATDALAAAGCETPRLDAELLICDALGVERAALVTDPGCAVPAAAARVIGERVRRRVVREPVAYILARRGFRRIELAVDGRVLIPRPETELLVEVALELPRGAWAHEVGTGSGAVALALLDERPDLRVTASERSSAAAQVARENARRLRSGLEVEVVEGLPAAPRAGRPARDDPAAVPAPDRDPAAAPVCDLVLANLPYVAEAEWDLLAPEIARYEPRAALVAGGDGLEAIRALVSDAPAGTPLALEHAPHQAGAVRALLADARTRADLAGRERVTVGVAR